MPMFTPTTTRVMATERTPPMFRPGNQANLEPALPANVSPMQDMLPGMGEVRSGNAMVTGLAASEKEIAAQVVAERESRTPKSWLGRSSDFGSAYASAQAALQVAQERNDSAGIRNAQQRLRMIKRQADAKRQQAEVQKGGAVALPWWKRGTRVFNRNQNTYAPRIPSRFSPPTPDPLKYEPAGISHQKGMRKIMAMQANIQPVVSYRALEAQDRMKAIQGLGNWFTDQMISGVPNWALAAAGGGAVALFLLKRK